jgi:hypothetical protein
MANNVMEQTATKALVSGRRATMVPAGMVFTHRQAVAHHGRSVLATSYA